MHRQRRLARKVVEKEKAKGEILEVHLVSHQFDIGILQERLARCPGLGTKRAGFEIDLSFWVLIIHPPGGCKHQVAAFVNFHVFSRKQAHSARDPN